MGQLNRMTQRHLQHGDAELDLIGRRAQTRQRGKRVEGRAAATERIPDPDPGKPGGLDPARVIGDATHRPIVGYHTGTYANLNAYLHDHLPERSA